MVNNNDEWIMQKMELDAAKAYEKHLEEEERKK